MKATKVLLVMLAFVIVMTTTAQSSKEPSTHSVQTGPAKEKIKKDELPQGTIKLLDGDAFKGWAIVQIYRIKSKDAQGKESVEYQVEVKKDNLNQTLKFDNEGNPK